MFLNLIVQSISETVAGGINSAEIEKESAALSERKALSAKSQLPIPS